jgi:plastocyanin
MVHLAGSRCSIEIADMLTRRTFLLGGGAILGSLAVPNLLQQAWAQPAQSDQQKSKNEKAGIVQILMKSDQTGARVWFDPIGIRIAPGQTVRWVAAQNVHTTTAYHPQNDNHSLRIPEAARPWNSGYLVNPGDHFDVLLTIEGVYDYYCIPHEMAGMVGRIIVGKPGGPGTLPYDYFRGRPGTAGWKPVPDAAQKEFPSIERIMREKVVHRQ